MALSVTGKEVESVLRELLPGEGYEIRNPRRKLGETGADIIARKGTVDIYIECIGFQNHPPTRSKQFYEAFFRAISRLKNGAHRCVMAPKSFAELNLVQTIYDTTKPNLTSPI